MIMISDNSNKKNVPGCDGILGVEEIHILYYERVLSDPQNLLF